MNERFQKVHFKHGSKVNYLWPIFKSVLDLTLLVDICYRRWHTCKSIKI